MHTQGCIRERNETCFVERVFRFFRKKNIYLAFFSLINFFSFSFLLRFLPFIEIFKIREVQVKE